MKKAEQTAKSVRNQPYYIAILRRTLRNKKTKRKQQAQNTQKTQMSQTKRAILCWRKWRLKLLKSKA